MSIEMPKTLHSRRAYENQMPDVDPSRLGIAIAGPILEDELAVPPWIELGDTPDGEPAIWWKPHPSVDGRPQWQRGGRANQAFWSFLELAEEANPERYLQYARSYGPLGLWPYETPDRKKIGLDHWVPSAPEGIWTPRRFSGPMQGSEYERIRQLQLQNVLYEPISEWKQWAGWFRSTLSIAVALVTERIGARRDWDNLGYGFLFVEASENEWLNDFTINPEKQRIEFARFIQSRFLRWSGLIPVVDWSTVTPQYTLAYKGEDLYSINQRGMRHIWPPNSLFPALVTQLLAAIGSGHRLSACDDCGRLHDRDRRPRSDQPIRCDECRIEARRLVRNESAQRRRANGRRT